MKRQVNEQASKNATKGASSVFLIEVVSALLRETQASRIRDTVQCVSQEARLKIANRHSVPSALLMDRNAVRMALG